MARELEQAEARLAEAERDAWAQLSAVGRHGGLMDWVRDFAIEVGRLRALAEVGPVMVAAAVRHGGMHEPSLAECGDPLCAALAAREGVQG